MEAHPGASWKCARCAATNDPTERACALCATPRVGAREEEEKHNEDEVGEEKEERGKIQGKVQEQELQQREDGHSEHEDKGQKEGGEQGEKAGEPLPWWLESLPKERVASEMNEAEEEEEEEVEVREEEDVKRAEEPDENTHLVMEEAISGRVATGDLYIWGSGECDQFPSDGSHGEDEETEGEDVMRAVPQLAGSHDLVDVRCGAMHTAALDKDGRVLTWGCNDDGALGRKEYCRRPTPVPLPAPVAQVCCGDSHTAFLLADYSAVFLTGMYREKNQTIGFPDYASILTGCDPVTLPPAFEPVMLRGAEGPFIKIVTAHTLGFS